MALITIDKSAAWSCENFFLPSIKNGTNEFISIIVNRKLKHDNSNLIDLYKAMSNDTRWEKILYIPRDIKTMVEYLVTTASITKATSTSWYQYGIAAGVLLLGTTAIILIILYVQLINKIVSVRDESH